VLVLVGNKYMNKNISWTYNQEFEENGFFIIRNLCDPNFLYLKVPDKSLIGTITNYNLQNKTYETREEPINICYKNSITRFNFPKYKEIQYDIKLVLENFLQRKLYKTYFGDRFYFANQELKRHTDNKTCEISCSIHISSNIENPWPLKLTSLRGEKDIEINLNPGDGLVYKGCQVEHWRDSLPPNSKKSNENNDDIYYHQAFFHYVLQDGNYVQFINAE